MDNRKSLDRAGENENCKEVVYKSLTYGKVKQERLIADDGKECIFLYFSALTADLVMFASACTYVWSSPAFQKLQSTDLEVNPLGVPLTPYQESWIAALPCLGATVGPLLSGKLADTCGRKKALMLSAAIEVVSYIVLAFATNIYLYYVTRFLLGIAASMCFTVLPVYNGEICGEHNRGKFGCLVALFIVLGILYAIGIGPLLSLKMFTLSCTVPLILFLVSSILIIPETPVYLASIDDRENATKALMKLRNKNRIVAETYLLEIIHMIDESSNSSNCGCATIFKTRVFRKGLIICIGVYFFQQASGTMAVLAFIGPIFELSGSNISPYLSSILVAAVQVVAALAASVLVEKLGRKFLLLISATICSISLIMLGLYFCLKDDNFYYIQSISWLPVTSLMVYVVFFNLGLGPVSIVLISEVLPPSIRSIASSIAVTFGSLTSFCVNFTFPLIIEFLGMASCCWLFGIFCAVGTIFIFVAVPETKGKTIVDIQKILSK